MRIFTTSDLLPDPFQDGRFWSHDDVGNTDRRLHPNWTSWAANSSWVPDIVAIVRADWHKYDMSKREKLEETSDAKIIEMLHTTWTSMKYRYRDAQKESHEKQAKMTTRRRYTRKKTVRFFSYL